MKNSLTVLFLLWSSFLYSQLEFCQGSKGDPIFHETFGTGNLSGPALPASVTNYRYVTGDPNDGEYTISGRVGQNNTTWHSYFPSTTTSKGRALIVNAGFSSGLFYTTRIEGLCENASYEFSAYLMNVYDRTSNACNNGGIPINVRFEIWDETDTTLLKEGSTGDIQSTISPVWERYALTFQSREGQGAVILKMFNNGDGGCGNDLAIDDIIFSSCGDLTEIIAEGDTGNPIVICESTPRRSFTLTATPDFSVYNNHVYQWQESDDGILWIDIPNETREAFITPEISSTTYYRVRVAEASINLENNLCSSVSEVFKFLYVKTPLAPVSAGDILVCTNEEIPPLMVNVEDDNHRVNWYDAAVGGNLLAENTPRIQAYTPGIYYAEAINNDGCEAGPRTGVSLNFIEVPAIEDEILSLCENSFLTLKAGVSGASYLWSTGETSEDIIINSTGDFSVTISTEGCRVQKNIKVIPVVPAVINRIISEEDRVIIETTVSGEFEYSLNGMDFQESNIFRNIRGGIYTAYVRDLSGCETNSLRFPHIVIQRHFSPNNDGYNDLFELKGVEYFNSSFIRIYNRYGSLIKSGNGVGFTWDGTFNGKPLPADDYWYEIFIEDLKLLKGNISLVRQPGF
ncbi:T9SS type B sorting domain-containing protein [Antarcticibacterium arcticum]|uniref:T9SS type B sorting domain-containing protein n=2 Tax=Antarcticibacterium arcticum TaxID=2585771 RepID=A0A5B8YQ84_9FLAO|nr:T9SS type B sorting domain-containing protein [Antarcticibacterium arcticum]